MRTLLVRLLVCVSCLGEGQGLLGAEGAATGLYYNRFRYYDPLAGQYISQDLIGLEGGNPTIYGYVSDPNSWMDVFGLMVDPALLVKLKQVTGGYNGQAIYKFTDAKTGKPYIGSTDNLYDRIYNHLENRKIKDLDSLTFDKYSNKTRQELFDIEAEEIAKAGGTKSGKTANKRRPRNTGNTATLDKSNNCSKKS